MDPKDTFSLKKTSKIHIQILCHLSKNNDRSPRFMYPNGQRNQGRYGQEAPPHLNTLGEEGGSSEIYLAWQSSTAKKQMCKDTY